MESENNPNENASTGKEKKCLSQPQFQPLPSPLPKPDGLLSQVQLTKFTMPAKMRIKKILNKLSTSKGKDIKNAKESQFRPRRLVGFVRSSFQSNNKINPPSPSSRIPFCAVNSHPQGGIFFMKHIKRTDTDKTDKPHQSADTWGGKGAEPPI